MLNRERNEPATLSFELRAVALDPSATSLPLPLFFVGKQESVTTSLPLLMLLTKYHEEEENLSPPIQRNNEAFFINHARPRYERGGSLIHRYSIVYRPRNFDIFVSILSRKILRATCLLFTRNWFRTRINNARMGSVSRNMAKIFVETYFRSRIFLISKMNR